MKVDIKPWPFVLLIMQTEMSLSWVFIEHRLKFWITFTFLVSNGEHLSPAAEDEAAKSKGKKQVFLHTHTNLASYFDCLTIMWDFSVSSVGLIYQGFFWDNTSWFCFKQLLFQKVVLELLWDKGAGKAEYPKNLALRQNLAVASNLKAGKWVYWISVI